MKNNYKKNKNKELKMLIMKFEGYNSQCPYK